MKPPSCRMQKILSSFARDLCSTTQYLAYTHKSSSSEIEANNFYRNIGNAFTTGCSIEPSVSCSTSDQSSEKNVFTAAPVSRFIFVNSPRLGLLMATRSKLPRVLLLNYHMFDFNLHVIRPKTNCRSVGRNSSYHHTKNRPCKSCQSGYVCAGS